MKQSISGLAKRMQQLLEMQNGTLEGGFMSITKNPLPYPIGLNEYNCVADRTMNNGCTNTDCAGLNIGGPCLNFIDCHHSTNKPPAPLVCGTPPPSIRLNSRDKNI